MVADGRITAEIGADGAADEAFVAAKTAAMRAHATQIAVDGPFFALSNDLAQPLFAREYYELAAGRPGAPAGERERDLFAGVRA